ncbi:MAG: hypothetical protein M3Y30_05185 [Gemmatimonadota bacterium]|nr:hypothetical protein [Gemmatimonadota bacterium]
MTLVPLLRVFALTTLGIGAWQAADSHAAPQAPNTPKGSRADTTPPSRAATRDSVHPRTRVSMRHVDFYVDTAVVLHIRHLDGTMRSKEGGPIVFDDKASFIITLDTAEVGLTGDDLTALLNKFVFGYKGSPLSHLHMRTEGDHVVQTGRMHKVITANFEITATMDVTSEGLIRIHPTKTKILGMNGEKLMNFLGLSLEKLLDLKGANGATVHGNDIFLDPAKILPPPTIEGRIVSVRVDGPEVVEVFGRTEAHERLRALVPPDTKAPNYMFYKGGTLRFGKLLMLDAEMQIVDLDPEDVFRFDLGRYNAQLVAGYERTLADGGLEVWMRDVDKLEGAGRVPARPALPKK